VTEPVITISEANVSDVDAIRELFLEYARSLDFSLSFQSFEDELAALPGAYAAPRGTLLLARDAAVAAGVVGLRPIGTDLCEMKRLYVRPAYRQLKLGRRLAEAIVDRARMIGYRAMRLDTMGGTMARAEALYRDLGFTQIPAYYDNPLPDVRYYELNLRGIR